MTFQKGYKRSPESTRKTSAALRAQAAERSKHNSIKSCPRCGDSSLVRWGIDRNGKLPRQRFRCANGHILMEPREYPFGKKFQSDPWKLLRALRLLKAGEHSLRSIATLSELDRYTIYKLHNHVGRGFECICGRELGHRGSCRARRDVGIPRKRRVPKPNAAYTELEYALRRMTKHLEEMNDVE